MWLIAALLTITAPADDSVWDRLAQCESGGDWDYNGGSGYDGGLQFDPDTWSAMDPPTDYAWAASREAQIAVARRLWDIQGWGAWPTCANKLALWGTSPDGVVLTLPVTR